MPGPLHPCTRCRRALVPVGQARCEPCQAKHQQQDVLYRGTAADRGYDEAWRRLRGAYVKQHPHCEDCLELGKRVPVAIVDHVVPHRGDDALRLDWDNLRSLCRPHHGEKTHTEGTGHRGNALHPSPQGSIGKPAKEQ